MLFCILGLGSGVLITAFIVLLKSKIVNMLETHPIPWKTEIIEKHFGGGFSIRDVNDRLVWWESYLLPLRFIVRIINIIDIFERHPAPWKVCKDPFLGWLSIRDIDDHLVCWGDHLILLQFVVGVVNSITGLRVIHASHHL